MAGFNDATIVQKLAVPAVCLLISFLGYFSQFLFHNATLEPGAPTKDESIRFNALLLALWYTYYKAITVDPGRYIFEEKVIEAKGRWCNKCAAPKPPRSHHCRHCGRCIPKMDHHCPWTRNCVSMTTFPHFLRFLFYANVSLWMLGYLLWQRFRAIWDERHLPAYLGPSLPALISLALTSLVCFFTSLALFIMLVSTVKSWMFNQTMIEGWEADRHESITEKGGRDWWDVTGPDGEQIRFEKVEFPYDIGILSNMSQAMGTSFFPLWLFPFAGHPKVGKHGTGLGWSWEENGFNRKEGMWPPPDPEKIRRAARQWPASQRDYDAELKELDMTPEERKQAFKERQERDTERRRGQLISELEEVNRDDVDDGNDGYYSEDNEYQGVDSNGDRLRDFGVDEDTDEEDVPISELLRRRRVATRDEEF